jgi:hypothetical protein
MKIGLFNNIKNLAPTLAENFVDEEISKNIYTEYSDKIGYYRNIIGIGSKYNGYYEYFINERNKGKYLSDYRLCKELINKIAK